MKKILSGYAVILIAFLFMAGVANAGDSVSIGMSCTIPAIPGVNVPLAEENTLTTEESASPAIQEEDAQDSPSILQDDEEQDIRLADGRTLKVKMQTVYSR